MELAAQALTDPATSLDAAFRTHEPWLVRRLALVVGDAEEARDLAQQVFLRAAERWPLPPEQDVARWLAVVGLRLALNERRRRKRWGFLAIRETDASW
ncbi:MAG TPA: sigma factor, partial [Verrucomicrobiae bacterium]|nr:sigma factor [Verrucomicrobiae bacterium]